MKIFSFLLRLSITFFFSLELPACYAVISDENLIAQSDLVVIGKITAIKEGGRGNKDINIATISVSEVLKGAKDLKEVKLAFPSPKRNMMASTDIFYNLDQEGIWLLRKDEKQNYYLADYPARFQPLENADKIKEIIGKNKDIEKVSLDEWKKGVIDKWIADNNLNRYGDSKDTIYLGGTPLFDKKTGSYIDRYEYIFLNHPEVRKLLLEKSRSNSR